MSLAADVVDSAVPLFGGEGLGAKIYLRVEARNTEIEGAFIPDKLILAEPNYTMGGDGPPWAMVELWSALSLYHEDTPQIVGDLEIRPWRRSTTKNVPLMSTISV